MNSYKNSPTFKTQLGAATLFISIMLLIAVTLISIFAARVGVMDQRISGNELRHKVAFATAEAGLEQAAAYLNANPVLHDGNVANGWATCTGNTTIFPCNLTDAEMVFASVVVGTSITPSINNILPLSDSFLVKTATNIIALGQGTSDDGTGAALAQVAFAKTSLLTPGEVPPLMIPSGSLSGNFNIVPNPNGGGPGVPISVWAKDTIDTSGANWKTCDHGEFKDGGDVCMDTKGDGVSGDSWSGCSCSTERSNSGNVNADIVMYPAADFPASPFVYLFGDDTSGDTLATLKPEIKALAEETGLVLDDCTTLNSAFNGLVGSALVWVTGDCLIGSNVSIGSRDKPIILVVEGELRVNAGAEAWGILMGLDQFVLNGGPVIHGSAISEIPSDLTNGNYSQVYDESVFDNLRNDTVNTQIAKVGYSWRNFTP
ncbi:MAG: PilX N-terminal domain-containing pilus assembly protein [Cycloclasticus sp.]|nr:PilX N-terminal domain-containing pilus assembly protein [Cycloclasticus sp.]